MRIRRVIDGKVYDTKTATEVATVASSGNGYNNFRFEETGLFITKKGNSFVAGKAAPAERTVKMTVENFAGFDTEQRIFVQIASQTTLVVRGANIFRELQERVMNRGFAPERNVRRSLRAHGVANRSRSIRTIPNGRSCEIAHAKLSGVRLRERLKDPSRIWSTEVGIAERSATEAVFGCRLICSQRGNAEPIPRSIPNSSAA